MTLTAKTIQIFLPSGDPRWRRCDQARDGSHYLETCAALISAAVTGQIDVRDTTREHSSMSTSA